MEFVAGSGEEGTSHAQEPGDHGCIFQHFPQGRACAHREVGHWGGQRLFS